MHVQSVANKPSSLFECNFVCTLLVEVGRARMAGPSFAPHYWASLCLCTDRDAEAQTFRGKWGNGAVRVLCIAFGLLICGAGDVARGFYLTFRHWCVLLLVSCRLSSIFGILIGSPCLLVLQPPPPWSRRWGTHNAFRAISDCRQR